MEQYPEAYIDYLVYFHTDRDFFECHEVLEDYWKEATNKQERVWVGLIQIAVGLYHERRGNTAGAERMISSSWNILEKRREEVEALGLDAEALLEKLIERLQHLRQDVPYVDMNLPINDPDLQTAVAHKAAQTGITFGAETDFTDDMIVHKHTLRPERAEVIQERKLQQEEKAKRRQVHS
ncbi:hypothetical protein B0H94_10310 [Salsuginibacillus halophilus]|uniref:DUF309 domain-containing protein n=1 Tax=Salsuginibacillus halophilus TaxID=517424 RepID=A0A2P8HW04_9BACI|nr:DUF309 domain-containing protein [Salsuginibacillus halophilus]PSL50399.1 hypothetical protein B0H94_10310 [Salsuginibacillus halophilus]